MKVLNFNDPYVDIKGDVNNLGDLFTDTIYDDTEVKGSIEELNESLSVIGKCKNLLNPTLKTTTQNGVTCTANGDGTYTFNGTTTKHAWFTLGKAKLYSGKTYRLCGLNKVGNSTMYIQLGEKSPVTQTTNDGVNVNITETSENYLLVSFLPENTTYNNVIYKPMITEYLTATYDDYVPYTGDGETLTHDVAEIKNDLGGLSLSTSGTTLTITNGVNTWTLNANS